MEGHSLSIHKTKMLRICACTFKDKQERKKERKKEGKKEKKRKHTFKHPITVSVSGEVRCVTMIVEYIKINLQVVEINLFCLSRSQTYAMTQERKKFSKK